MNYFISNKDAISFVEILSERCNCDYTTLSMAIIKSRIRWLLITYEIDNCQELINQFTISNSFSKKIIYDFSNTLREFFRDPVFLKQLRKKVNHMVRPLSDVKIWIPECGNGIEAYTLAIALTDTKAFDKASIIATDSNKYLLEIADNATYPADFMVKYIRNYEDFSGCNNIEDFIDIKNNLFKFRDHIRQKITFIQHDMFLDADIDNFHLIFCRNSLIYFDRQKQKQILKLFDSLLHHRGILCLGEKENFQYFPISGKYRNIAGKEKVYQKYHQ